MAVLTGSVAAANSVRQAWPGILPGIDKAVFAQMLPVKSGASCRNIKALTDKNRIKTTMNLSQGRVRKT